MPNGNILKSENFISKTKIYLIIIAILLIAICVIQVKLIPIAVVTYAILLTYAIWSNNKRKAELSEQLKDLTLNVNTTAKTTLINSPFPLAIVETDGNIIWKSEKFISEFEQINVSNEISETINRVKSKITDTDKKGNINEETIINDKKYQVLGSYVKSHKKNHEQSQEYTMILYFIDNTEKEKLEKEVKDNEFALGIIMIDNYEEITQRVSAEARPVLIANVEKRIYDWATKYDGIIIKSDRDTFYCIVSNNNLQEMIKDKMSILDEIKSINTPDTIQTTLSIAFSNDGKTKIENAESTRAVIDIALGRGGDQAIVKVDGKYEFFGGRTKELEKRTKVKARMVSHALTKFIQESDNVLIMGHSHSDMDVIGSAMGLYRLATTLGKTAKVVNETIDAGIERFIEEAKKTEEYTSCFVTKQEAENIITDNTLLIVVDINKKNYVEEPELLEKIPKVIVIDHHRRSTDYIENAILTFHEVYASSASELVTEIIEYSQVNVELTP